MNWERIKRKKVPIGQAVLIGSLVAGYMIDPPFDNDQGRQRKGGLGSILGRTPTSIPTPVRGMNDPKQMNLKGQFLAVNQLAVLQHRGRYVGRELKPHIDFNFPVILFSRN